MHFYELENGLVELPLGYTYFCYKDDDDNRRGDALRCPKCGRFISSLRALPPIRVELKTYNKQFGDIAFGPGDQILISERLRHAYEVRDMRGLEDFFPVEVFKHSKKRKMGDFEIPDYYHCSIVRSQAKYDQVASEFDWEDPDHICEGCCRDSVLNGYKRLVLISDTWEGHDIFYARGSTGTRVVTERFRQMFKEEELLGGLFIDLADSQDLGVAGFWPPPPP